MTGVVVEDGAIVGEGAVFKAGITVGKNSVIAMGSRCNKRCAP